MQHIPTFFGLTVHPNKIYKTNVNSELMLTRATIDPNASGEENSRLFVDIEKNEGPFCHLDCEHTTETLSIHISPGAQLILRVAGDCPIHVCGYSTPHKSHVMDNDFELESDSSYYEEDASDQDKEEENSGSAQ